ncbi:hypothetical protein BpHYR1_013219 [Brachionus plicatilis]|uniref:Uncharacterized protein n=1 Tax=Brachionus plicatilis TaxID=10195 RepID=A0A3M7QTG7_BRAPC|nr:hypothetical protein BpHYR1_013219 [Brachionus plicatilis]
MTFNQKEKNHFLKKKFQRYKIIWSSDVSNQLAFLYAERRAFYLLTFKQLTFVFDRDLTCPSLSLNSPFKISGLSVCSSGTIFASLNLASSTVVSSFLSDLLSRSVKSRSSIKSAVVVNKTTRRRITNIKNKDIPVMYKFL